MKKKKKARQKTAPPPAIQVAVIMPVPVAAKPVVTWQARGRRLLIQVQHFLGGPARP